MDVAGRLRDHPLPVWDTRLRLLLALRNLLEVYAPVCFMLGWQARNCVWSHRRPGTGGRVRNLLMMCLFVLLALTEGDSHHCEYVRTLMCCLLCWTRWHTDVPGACYTDECNEASLAQLGRWWNQHAEVTDVDTLMNMYLLVPPGGREASAMAASRPSAAMQLAVLVRLQALLRSHRVGITHGPWEPVRVCRAVSSWPAEPWFPKDLTQIPTTASLRNLARYCLGTLVS